MKMVVSVVNERASEIKFGMEDPVVTITANGDVMFHSEVTKEVTAFAKGLWINFNIYEVPK